ncbi:MAG: metal ABC transporter permease [Deltaproteobacteria bacterium]|nr:metal ABC transporter permease [Deltaproteobacteria bacterium]
MLDVLSYAFMQNAIAASILASIICGVIGPFIVARRMVFISGGLSHTAFGGLGIAYWMGANPLYGAVVFVLGAAVAMAGLEKKVDSSDLLIGIFWALGVAIGIVFIHMTPGFTPDLMTFLFGNILTVPRSDIVTALALVILICLVVFVFFKGFVSIALDEDYARARGIPVDALNLCMMVLMALSIVIMLQVVGIILVIALLTIPVAIAREITFHFRRVMVLSALWGISICLAGLAISYIAELPAGAAIILLGAFILGLIKAGKWFSRRLFLGRKAAR